MNAVRESTPLPKGMAAMGMFLFFGATMALLAGITLSWPGTMLDAIWRLNPNAYWQLAPLGKLVGIPFLFLAMTMAVAGIGWFQRRVWGWWLAVGILATQCMGDIVNTFTGHVGEGSFGVTVAGALLYYLSRPSVRRAFK